MVKRQEEKMLQLIDKSGEVTVCDGGRAGLHAQGVQAPGPSSQHPLSLIESEGRGFPAEALAAARRDGGQGAVGGDEGAETQGGHCPCAGASAAAAGGEASGG